MLVQRSLAWGGVYDLTHVCAAGLINASVRHVVRKGIARTVVFNFFPGVYSKAG